MKDKTIKVCDFVIEACFYMLLVVVTFSTSLVEIASTLLIIAWLVKKAADRDFSFFKLVPVRILILLWVWTVLSCVNSEYMKESFRGIFKSLEYGLVFIIVASEMKRSVFVKRTIFVISGIAVMICGNGLFQYFTGEGLIRHRRLIELDYMRRISSSFIHPNDFGVYLIVVSLVFMAFVLSTKRDLRNRLVFLALLILSGVCLFLTKSRGAWLSFSAAFLMLGALKAKRLLALFLVLLVLMFVLLPYSAQKRISDLADLKSGTSWERVMLWKGTLNMIKEHPVLGFGVNTYSRNFPKYKPKEYPDLRYTHNSYLHMASEIGIVGLLLFIAFLFSVFRYSFKGLQVMPPGTRKDLSIGVFAGVVGFSMNCVVDTHLYSVTLAVFFHLLLGFCFALNYHAGE